MKILNVKVDNYSKEKLIDLIFEKIAKKQKFYVLTPNPEIVMRAQQDPELMNALNNADISVPDGVGLKLANLNLNIIKGRQLMVDLIKNAAGKRVYLLGAKYEVNKKLVAKLTKDYPQVEFKGVSGPMLDSNAEPLSHKDQIEQEFVRKDINKFVPNLLFVAFETPKEQKWIARHIDKLKVNCVMEVGGAFDYLVGEAKVPMLMEILGLEWLWRVIREPKRVKRIFNAVVIFPIKLLSHDIIFRHGK